MTEKIILKSVHPENYPDLIVECKVIPNEEIGAYLSTIPEEKKLYAYKTGEVKARTGIEGEQISTVLKTIIDGKEYILSEETSTVKKRSFGDSEENDVVVTNISSTSNEQYVVKYEKFISTYSNTNENGIFIPNYDCRLLTQVDENLIIITVWGSKAVCLKGSYIVTYNALESDYNTLEQGAFNSTYQEEINKAKIKR